MVLTQIDLDTIRKAQADYFNTVKQTDDEGNKIKNNQYNQILQSEKLGYWVDVWQNNTEWGYIIREEKIVDGITYQKATNFGKSEDYRTYDWQEINTE